MGMKHVVCALVVFGLLLPCALQAGSVDGSPRFIATYFLTNVRCPSCLTIERWTAETIKSEFGEQLRSGVLEWRTINIDGEGNYHFVKDYNLYTKSVILSENVDGKEVRWKNLPKVWELLSNEDKFSQYLKDEISAFMGDR